MDGHGLELAIYLLGIVTGIMIAQVLPKTDKDKL